MTKLLGLGIGFILIITLVVKKKPLALAMAAGTLVAGLGTGLGVEWLAVTWGRALIHPDTLLLAMMVGSITLLSWIMAKSKLHERLVFATIKLLRSAKLAVMVIPPMIGALPIPGGAIVSAPLVDRPADMLGMSQPRKAAVNLVFRHATFFFLPFSSSLILASRMLEVDIYHLIRYLAPLGLVSWVAGYFTLVRGTKEVALPDADADATARPEIAAGIDGGNGGGGNLTVAPQGAGPAIKAPRSVGWEFLVSGSPIFVALTVGFVFPVPFWVAVICGIVLALGLSWNTRRWTPLDLVRGVDLKLVGAMFGIMSFREVVVRGQVLSELATILEASAIPLPLLAFTIALLISIVSANHNTTLGIAYPMILPLVAPHEVMAYAVLMFAASFVAYFSSPLHLCQIVTNDHCKVTLPQAFREYVWTLLAMVVAAWGLFFLYKA